MSILAPTFLVNYISGIALLLSVVVLVFFSDQIFKYAVIPLTKLVRAKTHDGIRSTIRHSKNKLVAKYASEGLATLVFLAYCFLGSYVVSEYFFEPLLLRMKNFILPVVIALFLFVSYIVNNDNVRKSFIKF